MTNVVRIYGKEPEAPPAYEYDGDLFNCGCQVTTEDLQKTLSKLGFELDKNQMHEVMRTVIFHIKR